MLSIGDFSRVTHLSVRTLRRYHDARLLVPAHVDATTGYRHYDVAQIGSAQVVHRLRELDVPLAEVHAILHTDDPAERAQLVASHVRRLEASLERQREALVALSRLLDPEPAPVDVTLRLVPATPVAAVTDDVDLDDVLTWYAGAAAELRAAVPAPAGPPGGTYDDALFQAGRGRAVVYLPTPGARAAGRVQPLLLPPVELAATTHAGPHDDVDVTYGRLGAWVERNALRVAGPVRETYLVGPHDTDDRSAWRTEIGWPVFRLSAAPDVARGTAYGDGRPA